MVKLFIGSFIVRKDAKPERELRLAVLGQPEVANHPLDVRKDAKPERELRLERFFALYNPKHALSERTPNPKGN